MTPEKLNFYESAGMGGDALKYLNYGDDVQNLLTTSRQPAEPEAPQVPGAGAPQTSDNLVSFEDPRFVDELMSAGSPELAEQKWAELTGFNNIKRSVDHEIMTLKRANPRLAQWEADLIAKSKLSEIMQSAPGLQALQTAKTRLDQDGKVASSVFDSMDYLRKAEVQRVMSEERMNFIPAVRKVAASMPVEPKETKPTTEGRDVFAGLGGGSGSGDSPQSGNDVVQLGTILRDAERKVQYLNRVKDDPALADQAVKISLPSLNSDPVVVDEKNPETAVQAEDTARKKEDAKLVVNALTELQQRGESPVLVANRDNFISTAVQSVKSKKPVLVELPDGKFAYRGFENVEEATKFFQDNIAKVELEKAKKALPPEYIAPSGIIESFRRGTGIKNIEDTDKDLAYWKVQSADESKSVADRTEAALQFRELQEYRKKREEKESDQVIRSEYDAARDEYLRLSDLLGNPKLTKEEKAVVGAELKSAYEKMSRFAEQPAVKNREAQRIRMRESAAFGGGF